MTPNKYGWKRYWVPREGSFAFDSEGFLSKPAEDAGWTKWLKTDVVGFEKLVSTPCLILLGEPGIGKSYALRDAESCIEQGRPSAVFLSVNLGEYADERRLIEDVFGSEEFDKWSSQGAELHVFLDSFDECLLRLDNVASLLAKQIAKLRTVEKLFFRITSRTAEWRMALEAAVKLKWGEDKVSALELAPLTKEQVVLAAEATIPDHNKFINEVLDREVVPFAIKPLTLELLFRVWKSSGGKLPPTQREIYETGCLELCAESNPERETPRLRRKLTPGERLAVASQIAAATVFCKRSAIYIGAKPSEILETDVSISELSYGSAFVDGRNTVVTDAATRETLDTGLFTARGATRLGWAHQTYAEFLAARFLREQQLSAKQILDIIVHPFDGKKLVPQLHEVASWVAKDNSAVFRRLLSVEPDILLRSDIVRANDCVKETLVDALLSVADDEDFRPDWWTLRARYRKLIHKNLSTQLRKVLQKKSFSTDGRCEAVHIIDQCELRKLSPLLVKLALASNEDYRVRKIAAEVASKLGDSKNRQKLKSIALGKLSKDPELELRGWGLKACWPGLLTASELFPTIVQPDHRRLGAYARFLSSDLVGGLSVTDLPIALRWAATQPKSHEDRFNGLPALVIQILRRAALHLDDELVLTEFASAMLSRLRKHDFAMGHEVDGFIKIFETKPTQRLKLIEAMSVQFQDQRHDAMLITRWGIRYAGPQDLDWLLARLKTETSQAIQKSISFIIYWVYYPDDAKRANAVIEAADLCPVLADVLSCWLRPMALSSEEVAKAKKSFQDELRWKKEVGERNKPRNLTPSPMERICTCLTKFENGDLDSWWHACLWAELEDDGQNAKEWYQIDLRELPGWKKATDETKVRLVQAAFHYITGLQALPEGWFDSQNTIYRPITGGLRALLLLANESPNDFNKISEEIWLRWIPPVLRTNHYNESDEFRILTSKAFEKAPQEIVKWALKVLDKENQEGDWPMILNKFPKQFGPLLGTALLARLKEGKLGVKCTSQLLKLLVDQKIEGALEVANGFIPRKPPKQQRRRDLALFASRLVLQHGGGDDWPKIRSLILADTSFGRSLLEGASHDYHHNISLLVRTLNESDIADLWEWTLIQYPFENDPIERTSGMGGTVTTAWAMADIRDGLLGRLVELGTFAACKELVRLVRKYPKVAAIRYMHIRCKEQMRRNSWQPLSPRQLFKLAKNHRSRFVQNADQLQDLVCDTLEGIQCKLHGPTPAARFLWHKDRPMEEEALSDWIKIELEAAFVEKAIILNREVQIHIKERTDIHVDAVALDPHTKELDRLKLIIEVKGCWHPELKTAMETQLLGRYLTDNDCRHGIYLVGWFLCTAWSKKDSRIKRVKSMKRQQLANDLSKQASQLSTTGNQIRSVVLDASIPWGKPRSRKGKHHGKPTAQKKLMRVKQKQSRTRR